MDIKLIIWDLDETLWKGSLAENDSVKLIDDRCSLIRDMNNNGLVSSICSKNDFNRAKEKLIEFNLWGQFVFPRISFSPKAALIKDIITDAQLRPANVLFVDDNQHNLEEAKFLIPELQILNALAPACDEILASLAQKAAISPRPRFREYRQLETRVRDRKSSASSNEDFLRSCDIQVAIVHGSDNMEFSDRIEELVNRANQLNFTRSRFEPATITDLLATGGDNYGLSLFMWDRYGYHGLVGFALLEACVRLKHFVFSCRIMNMGIEGWFLDWLQSYFKGIGYTVDHSTITLKPAKVDWVHVNNFSELPIRTLIWKNERAKDTQDIGIRFMSKCQSGALAHYSGLNAVSAADGVTGSFDMTQCYTSDYRRSQIFPRALVYSASSDYDLNIWRKLGAPDAFQACATSFIDFLRPLDHRLLVLLTPEDLDMSRQDSRRDADHNRMAMCNNYWRQRAAIESWITVLNVRDLAIDSEIIDNFHYQVSLLKKIGQKIGEWYAGS